LSSIACRSPFTPGSATCPPFARVTTGISGEPSPPVPRYARAIAWLVSQPSWPGTENFWSIAFVAAPAVAMPTTVRAIQKPATSLRWARIQQVKEPIDGF